jgi:predicted nucleotidyltransferase
MPTALQLTPAERQSYIEGIRHRAALLDKPLTPEEASAREQLLARVRLAAAEIKARFGVKRIILFGSLAHKAWFSPGSDVDLAVEGLEGQAYWEAWQIIEQIIGDRSIDLVDIATASPSLKQAIERHGVML